MICQKKIPDASFHPALPAQALFSDSVDPFEKVPAERLIELTNPRDSFLAFADELQESLIVVLSLKVKDSVPVSSEQVNVRGLEEMVDDLVFQAELSPPFDDDIKCGVPVAHVQEYFDVIHCNTSTPSR